MLEGIAEEEQREVQAELMGQLPKMTKYSVMYSSKMGPMSRIEKNLYLGSAFNAYNHVEIKANKISHIINVCENELSYNHENVTNYYQRIRYTSDAQSQLFYKLCILIGKHLYLCS